MNDRERLATIDRETLESRVHVDLNVDGQGRAEISTGIGFYDHMLSAFARHGRFDLNLSCEGDLDVDSHHTMEDVALVVGAAFNEALADRSGITRMGDATVPLDEALVRAVIDVSGRPYAVTKFNFGSDRIGDAPTEMIPHVIQSFSTGSHCTVHVSQLSGANDHHIAEAAMKALGIALDSATRLDDRIVGVIPSEKGTLTT